MSERRRSINPEFVEWLQIKKNLKERSSRDVKSHLLRADKIIDIDNTKLKEPDIVYFLSTSKNYEDLSPTTKSHLKRAVRLYQEYIKEKQKEVNNTLFNL